MKKLNIRPVLTRGTTVGLIILALLLQANYTVIGQMAASLFKPSILKNVPPLEQNQALAAQPAADLNAVGANPILASGQVTAENKPKAAYEDKSKRTEHTKTIVGTDGKLTKRISLAEPMHHKKNGSWD